MYINQQFGSSVCCLGETRTAKGLGLFRSRQNGNPSPGLRRLRQRVLKALDEDLQNPYRGFDSHRRLSIRVLRKERIRVSGKEDAPYPLFLIPAKGPETLSRLRVLSGKKLQESTRGKTRQRQAIDAGNGVHPVVRNSQAVSLTIYTEFEKVIGEFFTLSMMTKS